MNLYNKKVLKLLGNKNYRNNQNYVIRNNSNLELKFLNKSFVIFNNIIFFNKISILLKILHNIFRKNNLVFLYSPNKYLVLKNNFYKYSKK